jgi:hypothetical protein
MCDGWNDIPTFEQWRKETQPYASQFNQQPYWKSIERCLVRYHQAGRPVDTLRPLSAEVDKWGEVIERTFSEFRYSQATRIQRAQRVLRHFVTEKMQQYLAPGSTYQKVVCIAYEAFLAGDYPPGSDTEAADLEGRWKQMQAAIEIAYAKYQREKRCSPEEDRSRLKIFMAPEFYFRGPSGAYKIELFFEFLDKIPEFTKRRDFQDWLFVLGTFVCTTVVDDARPNPPKGNTVENYALVQKGGYAGRDHVHDLLVAKEFPSAVDFETPDTSKDNEWYRPDREAILGGRPTKALPTPGSREFDPQLRKSGRYTKFLASSGVPAVKETGGAFGGIFTMDRITFGLEVCRDHLHGRLAHCSDKAAVKIQLVPACGANLIEGRDNGSCLPNAVAFNVDGNYDEGDRRFPPSIVRDAAGSDIAVRAEEPVRHARGLSSKNGLIKIYQPVDIPA